jgi:hypothetical protein
VLHDRQRVVVHLLEHDAITSFLKESADHGLGDGDLDAVLWDTPVRFYRQEDRFGPT